MIYSVNIFCVYALQVGLSAEEKENFGDALSVTPTHTTHIIPSTAPTYAARVTPGFVGRPFWSYGICC